VTADGSAGGTREPRPVFIGGRWVASRASAVRRVEDPTTRRVLAEIAESSAEDLALACAAARAAHAHWRRTRPSDRAAALTDVATAVRATGESLAKALTEESGRPIRETREELAAAVRSLDAAAARALDATPDPDALGGVVAVAGGFDRPIGAFLEAAGAAIGAGAALICKPPAEAPLSSLALAQAFAPLPAGLVNVITGGAATAAALAASGAVDRMLCDGTVEACAALRRVTACVVAPVAALETLACVVDDGADLERAAAAAVDLALRAAGQCVTPRARLYVQRRIAAAFADQLHLRAAFLEVGDPRKPDTDLGPLISHAAMRRAEEQVARALQAGARLKLGGRGFSPWGLAGHFFQPTILTDTPRGSPAALAEFRAPVLSLVPFEDAQDLAEELGQRPARVQRLGADERAPPVPR
jgi:acyl-CoA reductase-like NAD-dependent aldehyde dehydrogenase